MPCIASIVFLRRFTGVISGAMLPLQRVFHLSYEQEEVIVSSSILAAFASSLAGGAINNMLGRRLTIMIAALIFVSGAIIICTAQQGKALVVGQIALGIGIGIESLTSPMYISEVAKPSIRGLLVSMYGLLMCLGQFVAGMVDGLFGPVISGWRFMFGFGVLPGLIMFFGFIKLPESPGWLVAANRHDDAKEVLKTLRDTDDEVEIEMIKCCAQSIAHAHAGDGDGNKQYNEPLLKRLADMIRHPPTRRALVVGCGLMVLQQFCGINGVMYYAATIYKMSGFDEITSIWLSGFTALAQIAGLAISVYLVEKAGRRVLVLMSLLLTGVSIMGLGWSFYLGRLSSSPVAQTNSPFIDDDGFCYFQPALVWSGITTFSYDCVQIEGCGYCDGHCVKGDRLGPFDAGACPDNTKSDKDSWSYDTVYNPHGWMSVVFMVLILLVFGIGMGALPWTVNSEIYLLQHRSLSVSLSTSTNWICNFIVTSTFLTLSRPSVFTIYGSFWFYSAISFIGVIWLYFALPETKGLSIHEIEKAFSKPSDERTSSSYSSTGSSRRSNSNMESLLLLKLKEEDDEKSIGNPSSVGKYGTFYNNEYETFDSTVFDSRRSTDTV